MERIWTSGLYVTTLSSQNISRDHKTATLKRASYEVGTTMSFSYPHGTGFPISRSRIEIRSPFFPPSILHYTTTSSLCERLTSFFKPVMSVWYSAPSFFPHPASAVMPNRPPTGVWRRGRRVVTRPRRHVTPGTWPSLFPPPLMSESRRKPSHSLRNEAKFSWFRVGWSGSV